MARGTHCWYNGKILPVGEAKISLFTHGLHYGSGAFEGIRAYKQSNGGGAVFRLVEHMQRFEESGKILGFTLPYNRDQLVQAVKETIRANKFEECYIRPILFVGDGPLGVYTGAEPPIDIAILCWEWGAYLGQEGGGARLKVSSFVRPHVNSAMTKGKITGQYVNSVLAKREALMGGFDEAILLDPEGYVTEGSGENIFMVTETAQGSVVKTTPLTSILNGITRQTILEYFHHKGIKVVETRFTRDELWCAQEVFLSGTAAEITPVTEIDLRKIGFGERAGRPGPVTQQLQKDFQEIVRGKQKPAFAEKWLSPLA
jgi:branched-chain amino acid aminotransferase